MKQKIFNIVNSLVVFIAKLLPMKKQVVFESNPDFADNTLPVYNKMIEKGYNEKYKFVWLLNGTDTHNLPSNVSEIRRNNGSFADKMKCSWIIARSKYIIDCNTYVRKCRKGQIRIHLKHGLPIKDASAYTHGVGALDVLCVPSEKWLDICSKEHGVDKKFIKPLGFPRNDELVVKEHSQKSVMWMPTYRFTAYDFDNGKKINDGLKYGLPGINSMDELSNINAYLAVKNAILYVRFHPAQDTRNIKIDLFSNIKLCDNEFLNNNSMSLYEFLCITDGLISDYSSIYYDYLKLEKPIALSVCDFDEYLENNGIICKTIDEFKATFPAEYLYDYDDLFAFIRKVVENDVVDCQSVNKAKELYDMASVPNSAETILNYMIENFDF